MAMPTIPDRSYPRRLIPLYPAFGTAQGRRRHTPGRRPTSNPTKEPAMQFSDQYIKKTNDQLNLARKILKTNNLPGLLYTLRHMVKEAEKLEGSSDTDGPSTK